MIKIHFDFTDGTEVSYERGCLLKDNFTTNCLDFFNNNEDVNDVVVIDSKGNYISRKILMSNQSFYTKKHMKKSHDLQKMLKANAFDWRKEI